jgi:hypothetical protein
MEDPCDESSNALHFSDTRGYLGRFVHGRLQQFHADTNADPTDGHCANPTDDHRANSSDSHRTNPADGHRANSSDAY